MSEVGTYDHLTRQLDLIPVDKLGVHVNIIGCGAIGSFAALSLAKMGITNINVWDFDDVSIENMSNQFFRYADIGHNKAEALKGLVYDFTGVHIQGNDEPWIPEHAPSMQGIVVSCVDDMAVRKQIFEAVKDSAFGVKFIIDPRMGAEMYSQYVVNPFDDKDDAMYQKTLYANSEAVQERCTAKSTIYTATLASGLICKTVKNLITQQDYSRCLDWDLTQSGDHSFMSSVGNA